MKAVYALFGRYDQAKAAVQDLLDQGFDQEDMNVIVQDSAVEVSWDKQTASSGKPGMPPGLDKLLAGEKTVHAADTGSVYAAGERATLLANTAAAPGGKVIGEQLKEFGIDEEPAAAYLNGIKGGGLLFWMITDDDHARDGADILSSHKGSHIVLNPVRRRRR